MFSVVSDSVSLHCAMSGNANGETLGIGWVGGTTSVTGSFAWAQANMIVPSVREKRRRPTQTAVATATSTCRQQNVRVQRPPQRRVVWAPSVRVNAATLESRWPFRRFPFPFSLLRFRLRPTSLAVVVPSAVIPGVRGRDPPSLLRPAVPGCRARQHNPSEKATIRKIMRCVMCRSHRSLPRGKAALSAVRSPTS